MYPFKNDNPGGTGAVPNTRKGATCRENPMIRERSAVLIVRDFLLGARYCARVGAAHDIEP